MGCYFACDVVCLVLLLCVRAALLVYFIALLLALFATHHAIAFLLGLLLASLCCPPHSLQETTCKVATARDLLFSAEIRFTQGCALLLLCYFLNSIWLSLERFSYIFTSISHNSLADSQCSICWIAMLYMWCYYLSHCLRNYTDNLLVPKVRGTCLPTLKLNSFSCLWMCLAPDSVAWHQLFSLMLWMPYLDDSSPVLAWIAARFNRAWFPCVAQLWYRFDSAVLG